MNLFQKEYFSHKEQMQNAMNRVLTKGQLILGEELIRFEDKFARYLGVKWCVGVGNGLDALRFSLMANGIKAGDEVITVSNTFIATALAISHIGATPVFVDVGDDFLIDINQIEASITEKTTAIIPVHLFGLVANMPAILAIAHKHGLKVIEDACQAHGAYCGQRKAGTFGNSGCFSFYPTKNLGCYGDGGAIVTDSDDIAERCRRLRNYGRKDLTYDYTEVGFNSRLDELQAAVLTQKLIGLDMDNIVRNILAQRYWHRLTHIRGIEAPSIWHEPSTHVYHQYVCVATDRDRLLAYLHENDVMAGIHYPVPIHKQKMYDTGQVLLNTERLAQSIISLPIHPHMPEDEVERVCSLIATFYNSEV